MRLGKGVVAVATAISVQVAAIGWLVWRYEHVVQYGEEVRLKCRAYDPYDPLRGRYLDVTVIDSCTNILFEVDADSPWRSSKSKMFAKLVESPNSGGIYRVEAVAHEPTDDGLWVRTSRVRLDFALGYENRRKNEPWEAFERRRAASGVEAAVHFPGCLFIDERIAPTAEDLLSKDPKTAVAVYRVLDGRIVLVDIEQSGKPVLSAARAALGKKGKGK